MLVYGNGRSYGDSCLSADDEVLSLRPMRRLLYADWEKGVIRAEAGILLAELLEIVVPRGWFLPVVPGTRWVTLGGAVANDVHGKNHHRRGSFGHHVQRLKLIRSDGETLECSPTEQSKWFEATIGGLGLTGAIEWVEIGLLPIQSSDLTVSTRRFSCLSEFFDQSAALDEQHEFAVAWLDCAADGGSRGRGVFMHADFAQIGKLEAPANGQRWNVPLAPPFSLINEPTLRCFNEIYWRKAPAKPQITQQECGPFFFPLDSIGHWNRIYGRRGFQQYQCVLPFAVAQSVLDQLLKTIKQFGQGSFLAVLKCFGTQPSVGLISFPMSGVTLALDFPQSPKLDQQLFPALDKLVHEAGGRLYPAKDAHLSQAAFQASYPSWTKVEALRDPAIKSRFWARVTE